MQLHKATGQARVTLSRNGRRRDYYLGAYGSPDAAKRYADLIGQVVDRPEAVPPKIAARGGRTLLVAELVELYDENLPNVLAGRNEYALYQGRATAKAAGDALLKQHGALAVEDFGPVALRTVRQTMLDSGRLSRGTINNRMSDIVRIISWGVSEEYFGAEVLVRLRTVRALRRGDSGAREGRIVEAVDAERFWAVVEHLEARGEVQTAGMLRLMWLTGARGGELLLLTQKDIDRAAMIATVHEHKTIRFTGQPKRISLSKEALAVIDRATLSHAQIGPDAPVFRSKRGGFFMRGALYAAVTAACNRLGIQRWHPHQIRHAAATRIYKALGSDAARVAIGHSSLRMTERYSQDGIRDVQRQAAGVLAEGVA
jgi:integrase